MSKPVAGLVEAFTDFYAGFSPEKLAHLHEIYDPAVCFEDPLHRIEGLPALQAYFSASMSGMNFCRFEFEGLTHGDKQLCAQWVMHYSHPKLKNGAHLSLPGVSVLTLEEKIISHRDYYDMGAMLYEHVPLLGTVIQRLKQRLIK